MPTSNIEAISDMYDARSASYDSSNNSLHIRQTKTYLSHLTPYLHPGASLLDLACGTGLLTLPAKSLVGAQGRVVGIDVSKGMLDIARQKSQEQGIDIEWYEHDVSDLTPLNLGSTGGFDVITCASALILLPSPSTAVRNWTQVLKPGGRVMTDVQLPTANIVMEIFASIGPGVGQTLKWDMTLFRTQDSLCKVFEDAGLEVEQVWESEAYGSKEVDVEDAERIFGKALQNPMFADFGTEGVRDRALVEFTRRLKELGGAEGQLREETRFWMCIGRKLS
ncbi:ubiE/COQ5 methyltransferase [Glonium stellatum]|uniref:UbiE/COQ5 methyltransferase n=1 Tax=Glonium stellatum TaxID=574774 RepID=A0A8E2F8Y5_9PEZI|nr:ubiE/COQ5 methyltransferase [Glonium stellatum]